MLNSQEINALGQICNYTWGEASTNKSPTMSITTSLSGDKLTLKYVTIIYLASEVGLRNQLKKFEEESIKLMSDYVGEIKKAFKTNAGRGLKLKDANTSDSVEMITTSPYTPRKTAYYRRNTVYTCM